MLSIFIAFGCLPGVEDTTAEDAMNFKFMAQSLLNWNRHQCLLPWE